LVFDFIHQTTLTNTIADAIMTTTSTPFTYTTEKCKYMNCLHLIVNDQGNPIRTSLEVKGANNPDNTVVTGVLGCGGSDDFDYCIDELSEQSRVLG